MYFDFLLKKNWKKNIFIKEKKLHIKIICILILKLHSTCWNNTLHLK